ncbi:MAG TPA: hypothetical protein VEZ88_00550 [Steroidobacteraceae bacterium]|nr:hypothetical protein [Steroidobacteraceae bacterium]
MKTAAAITAFIVLVLQSGGQIQGAGEQTMHAQPRRIAATPQEQPQYCQRLVANDITTAVLRQDDDRLFLEGGAGMTVADF